MQLGTFVINKDVPFSMYLLSDILVKKISKEFEFYNVRFYRPEKVSEIMVYLDYPKYNMYWYLDFTNFVKKEILTKDTRYESEWNTLLFNLKKQIKKEVVDMQFSLSSITRSDVIRTMFRYNLRNYQAFDLLELLVKMRQTYPSTGLILSEQRTGKTRIALAAALELVGLGNSILIICPKSATISWLDEIHKMQDYAKDSLFNVIQVSRLTDVKSVEACYKLNARNLVIINYELFRRLSKTQMLSIVFYKQNKNCLLIGDEVHRLRNFKTLQSTSIFDFKDICKYYKINLNIIGVSGTPAVKESSDIFGTLSLINYSKIGFNPYYKDFNQFKEYFYNCEDTSFGKICLSLRRAQEMNYIIQLSSIQTKQKDLDLFKNYKIEYKKVELDLDTEQKFVYDEVEENMEFGKDIDCENKLVQLTRLQQVCIDPSGLVAVYDNVAPKLKYLVKFALANKNLQFIVMCKQVQPLKHLQKLYDINGISSTLLYGPMSVTEREESINKFRSNKVQIMLLQQDVGKESITLPEAKCIIFLNRDYAQGFNEQAEARMTPFDGLPTTKYVIDLVMRNTVEEHIYDILVNRKQSINSINSVYKKKED